MITVISHIFNEEYLLPYWLQYHKLVFDHGIIIDYRSTDHSVEIIKQICPTWEIRTSRNTEFDARKVDQEVMDIEAQVNGYKIALTITEWLLSTDQLHKIIEFDNQLHCYSLKPLTAIIDSDNKHFNDTSEFIKNFKLIDKNYRLGSRYLHNYPRGNYHLGRHVCNLSSIKCENIYLVWCGFYPWNQDIIKRKLQIAPKMSDYDKKNNLGFQHLWDLEKINLMRSKILDNSIDLIETDAQYRQAIDYSVSLLSSKNIYK